MKWTESMTSCKEQPVMYRTCYIGHRLWYCNLRVLMVCGSG